ncbi:cyclic dof factor 3-like [Camellia sinensis]|uniref:Dof-type domain-containing protein n=1 Tax=Camellia sinensis var. sinensis TaxID=542762 RepID=A0A4S4D5Z8_CAMSN|nr:cyclic dof factor 3-like [Camellia sinensis]THF97811.1 hypothetical protein TEA_007355 [Camellia sinensis var. sinensis]
MMVTERDPAIKLFGKEIPLPRNGLTCLEDGRSDHDLSSLVDACLEAEKVSKTREEEENEPEADHKYPLAEKPPTTEDPANQETLLESDENPKTPSSGDEKPPKTENDGSDTNSPEQKTLKKPDKILPCPRCKSMDTKFCYYNNYNVNQPRHFCKSCQRYWTAGGTMRNVPVGAGRRKNKNSASSHCRHITISKALHSAEIDTPNGIHRPAFKTNGTVLSFGTEAPIFESVACVLNLAEKKAPVGGEKGDDCSSGSSVTTSNSLEGAERNGIQERFVPQIPCLPGVPCPPGVPYPYPWNTSIPVPAICPSVIPMPFYPAPYCPAPYWNCSVPDAWSIPYLPTLGKRSRDGDLVKPSNSDEKEPKNSERSILIPKTLRIDDPDEAARSSIWTTLGIKNDSISGKGLFKAFEPKGKEKNHIAETLPSMQANPAAFSRSLSFQEAA